MNTLMKTAEEAAGLSAQPSSVQRHDVEEGSVEGGGCKTEDTAAAASSGILMLPPSLSIHSP